MNASVAFAADRKPDPGPTAAARPVVIVPPASVRDGAVFLLLQGKAVRRAVKTGPTSAQGLQVDEGLTGGEDLIVNPPAGLKDGDKVRQKT
jgi:HlyD family secretion protein